MKNYWKILRGKIGQNNDYRGRKLKKKLPRLYVIEFFFINLGLIDPRLYRVVILHFIHRFEHYLAIGSQYQVTALHRFLGQSIMTYYIRIFMQGSKANVPERVYL